MAKVYSEQEEDRKKKFELMFQSFENQFPIDSVFDKIMIRGGVASNLHLEIYKYKELKLIRIALQQIANKK